MKGSASGAKLESSREGTRVGLDSHRASSEAPGGVCTLGSNTSHYWERTQVGSKTTTISSHEHFWLLGEKTPGARRSQVLLPDAEHIYIQRNRTDFPLCSRKMTPKCFFRSYLPAAQLPERAAASATDLRTPPDSPGYQILSLFDKQIFFSAFQRARPHRSRPYSKTTCLIFDNETSMLNSHGETATSAASQGNLSILAANFLPLFESPLEKGKQKLRVDSQKPKAAEPSGGKTQGKERRKRRSV